MADDYGQLIRDELAAETAITVGLRQRAISVVTTASALVTVLTGLVAIAVGSDRGHHIRGASVAFMALAITAFLGAATLALLVNVPWSSVDRADPDDLQELVEKEWRTGAFRASQATADIRVEELRSLRDFNDTIGKRLVLAFILEVIAVLFVGVTAILLVVA